MLYPLKHPIESAHDTKSGGDKAFPTNKAEQQLTQCVYFTAKHDGALKLYGQVSQKSKSGLHERNWEHYVQCSVEVIGKANVVPKPIWRIGFGRMGLHVNNTTSCVIVLKQNANLLFQRVMCTDIAMGTSDVA